MQHRLTLANMVGVVWTTYLTHKADLSKKEVMLSDHDVISDKDCEDMELESWTLLIVWTVGPLNLIECK